MMREEFIQRTGYTPEIRRADDGWTVEYDEYDYIEQSYYDSDCVNKDEFCKEWLKSYKAGFWKRELQLLIKMEEKDATIREKNDRIKILNDDLGWEIDRRIENQSKVNELIEENVRLRKENEASESKLEWIRKITTGECQIAK